MNKKIPEYVQAYVPDYEDLAILVTMAKGLGHKLWNFSVDFTDLSAVPFKGYDQWYDIPSLMTETMNRYSSLFLRDVWEPESLKGFKNTIIFTE